MSFAVVILLFAESLSVTPAVGEPLLVRKAAFECLVEKIDKLKIRGRQLRVDIRDCPVEIVTGYTPPQILKRRTNFETTLVLDEGRIACIRRNRNKISNYALAQGEYYLIDLKRCARPAS